MSEIDALEAARNAEINLNNMVKMMPVLSQHPLLPLVKEQIQTCIKELEEEPADGEGREDA